MNKNTITKTAAAALTKGTIVKLDSSDSSKVAACGASDANAIGVVLDNAAQGESVAVALLGLCNSTVEVIASAAISAGAKVYQAADGKVKPAPEAGLSAQTVYCVGVALAPAYASGNIIEIAHRAATVETIPAAE